MYISISAILELQEDFKMLNEVLFFLLFVISRGVFKDWSSIPSVLPQSIAQALIPARRQGPAPLAEHHLHGNHYHGNGIGREVGGLVTTGSSRSSSSTPASTCWIRRWHQLDGGPGSTGEMLVTLFKNILYNLKSLNAKTDKRQFQSF